MFSVFKNINNLANKSKILDGIAIFCAKYLLYLMIAFVLIFAVIVQSQSLFILPLLSGLFAAFVGNKIIYIFYKEKRPAAFAKTKILIPVPKNPSFPSRHASLVFGMSFYLFLYNIPLAIIFVVLSCLVGVARVFCGVHWFRDIVAGVLVGFVSVIIVHALINCL